MRLTHVTDDVRTAILDAAERLLERYGYKKMTVDDIAREAGIGKGSVYLHFPSKEAVALSCIDRINDQLREKLRDIAQRDEPYTSRVRVMLRERVIHRFDSIRHSRASLDEMLDAILPALYLRRSGYLEAEAVIFADVLREGAIAGVFAIDDAKHMAHTILIATNGLLPHRLSPAELGDRDEVIASVDRIAMLLLHGLIARGDDEYGA